MKNSYDLQGFTWFQPQPRNCLAITIPNGIRLNINAALLKEIPKKITIGFDAKQRVVAILETEVNEFRVPKSGSIHAEHVIKHIVENGVRLPARFSVQRYDNAWIGTLDPQKPPVLKENPPRKPRKRAFPQSRKEAMP